MSSKPSSSTLQSASAPINIHICLQGGDNEYVVIKPPLPPNPYDLIYLLKVETASRANWRDVAFAYFREGMWDATTTVLEEATSDGVDSILRAADDVHNSPVAKCTRLDLLAALAGSHIMSAELETIEAKRRERLRKAADVFSRADKIDLDDPSIWAARGWAEFHAGKSSAMSWFDNAKDKALVLGSMGLAALHLHRGKGEGKRDVVSLLVSALRTNICPGGVWTGLAYALFKEGRLKAARNVARRAVKAVAGAKNERLEALYLVALVEDADKESGSVEHMVAALREAYIGCGGDRDPRILALIAELHFFGGDFVTAERMAKKALDICESGSFGVSIGGIFAGIRAGIKQTALFQLARAQHHLGKIDEAVQGFEEIKRMADSPEGVSAKINSSVGAPKDESVNTGAFLRLGLLKLSTSRKEDEPMAQECLEKVVKESHDRCGIAMRALGVLLGRKVLLGLKRGRPRGGEMYQRAVSLLKKGLAEDENAKKDIPAQLVYGSLVEDVSPQIALNAYREAVKALEEESSPVDPEIWNNMASLLARLGHIAEAKDIVSTKIDRSFAADCKTVDYNEGRLAEMDGDVAKAEQIFRGMRKGHPHYYEAITRIAIMAMGDEKRADEAESLLKEAMDSPTTKSVAAAVLSTLYTSQKRFKQAQEVLETNRHDGDYLALSFSSFMHRFLDSLDQDRKARFLVNHIGTPLISILRRSKRNSFAANGVGVYFAESKMMSEARDAFTAAGAGPFTTKTAKVNLAHTQVHLGHRAISDSARVTGRPSQNVVSSTRAMFEQADKLYRDALEATPLVGEKSEFNSHCELLLYTAWGQFEAREFREAADILIKLTHLAPMSPVAWFNLGQSLLESATVRVANASNVLEEMQLAKDEFEGSRHAFLKSMMLSREQNDPISRSRVDRKVAYGLERYVRQQGKSHDVKLRNAILAEEEREEKRNESLEILRKRKERDAKLEREAQAARLKKEEELRKAFEESKMKKEKYEEEYERELQMKSEDALADEDDMDDAAAAPTPQKKSKSKRRKRESQGENEKPAKKERKAQKLVKKESNDSGSEYSDVGENNSVEDHDAKLSSGDGFDGEEGASRQPKRRRFSVTNDDDEEGSDTGF
eukprot:GFKZ01005520.1.p1 GENE.GFKZ01005520.1~~GFKZ01005520.1.p1  ORF type:complete len:1115 (-),score=231.88 GFKZ01005520.1:3801-7145(-)